MKEWTDEEKAAWILEHGEPDYAWLRKLKPDGSGDRIPIPLTVDVPPWIPSRIPMTNEELETLKNEVIGEYKEKWL